MLSVKNISCFWLVRNLHYSFSFFFLIFIISQLGNPTIDTYNNLIGMFKCWWNHGLISNSVYKRLREHCPSEPLLKRKGKCDMAWKNAMKEMGKINIHSLFHPPSKDEGSDNRTMIFGEANLCLVNSTLRYINKKQVIKALHAQTFRLKSDWKHCRYSINKTFHFLNLFHYG